MLFASTTNATAELGAIASIAFSDVAPFLYFIIGIILAFFILETLIDIMRTEKGKRDETWARADRAQKEYNEAMYK